MGEWQTLKKINIRAERTQDTETKTIESKSQNEESQN